MLFHVVLDRVLDYTAGGEIALLELILLVPELALQFIQAAEHVLRRIALLVT